MKLSKLPRDVTLFLLIAILATYLASCKKEDSTHDWPVYRGGSDANNYSHLTQVNKDNVKDLQEAWTFYPGDEPENFRFWKYECSPIVVGDKMYLTSAWRVLYAIDASNGEKIWEFDPLEGARGGGVLRGVTYWTADGEERIFVAANNKLFSVDAKTGQIDSLFGDRGRIDLNIDEGGNRDIAVRVSTPGIIYKDLIILGGAVSESSGAAPGHVRAFNVRTGALVWTFHTIPWPGEVGYETWPEEAYKNAGGANNWAGMSLDEKRAIVYVPTGSPTYDYYGANRIGSNLFGNCIIALNAATGELVWYFQTVHHDIWDYDLPAAPNLITVEKDGKKIDALAQPSKMGFIYVLNRETGQPIFPIEEREVPPSKMPGEKAWPTQPFPSSPKSFARQSLTGDDLAEFSAESLEINQKILNGLWHEGLFTPPDTTGTLLIPGSRGGAEWGGAACDVSTGVLYINSNESPELGRMSKVRKNQNTENETLYGAGQKLYLTYCAACHGADRKGIETNPSLIDLDKRFKQSEMLDKLRTGSAIMPSFAGMIKGKEDQILAFLTETGKDVPVRIREGDQDTSTTYLNITAHGYFLDAMGHPAIKPPWGTLNAIDLNTGDFLWKIPLGNDSILQKPGDPPTGRENYGGPVVTAGGLVIIAATLDSMLRVFDKDTGALLWERKLPGNGLATPSLYMIEGKQYIVIAVSVGENLNHVRSAVIAFALPDV